MVEDVRADKNKAVTSYKWSCIFCSRKHNLYWCMVYQSLVVLHLQ